MTPQLAPSLLDREHVAPGASPALPYGGRRPAPEAQGPHANGRRAQAHVDPLFLERWSPRAFRDEPISREEILTLVEAARWAPSSFNEQPWKFLYAVTPADRERFASVLVEFNRSWAGNAPALLLLLTRKQSANGTPNPFAAFDAGAAWMSLALQARLLGLDTHAMGGVDREKAFDVLGIPRGEYDVLVAIAVGKRGDAARLPAMLAERERPSLRKPLGEIASEGGFRGDAN